MEKAGENMRGATAGTGIERATTLSQAMLNWDKSSTIDDHKSTDKFKEVHESVLLQAFSKSLTAQQRQKTSQLQHASSTSANPSPKTPTDGSPRPSGF